MELVVKDLYKKYFGYDYCLKGINLSIPENSTLCIYGIEGSGKSTLIKVISGLEEYQKGEIVFKDKKIETYSFKERNFSVYTGNILNPEKTVFKSLVKILISRGLNKKESESAVRQAAKNIGTENIMNFKFSDLTFAQKFFAEFTRLAMRKADLYLIDDPFENVPSSEREEIYDFLKNNLRKLGGTKIIATADKSTAINIGDLTAVLTEGIISECGKASDIFLNPETLAACNMFSPDINTVKIEVKNGSFLLFNKIYKFPDGNAFKVYEDREVIAAFYPTSLFISENGLECEIYERKLLGEYTECFSHIYGQHFSFMMKTPVCSKKANLSLKGRLFLFDINSNRIIYSFN